MFVEEKVYEPLQLLLSNQDDTLLKCILELLQQMIEKEKKLHLFRNNYIIDCLIKILETYKDIEVIKRAVALLNALLRDISIIEVFKDLKGLEIIAQIYIGIDTEEIKGAFYVCFKLLSEIEYDLLHEMQKLCLV